MDWPLLLELILPNPRPLVSVFGHPPEHGQATVVCEIYIAVADANNKAITDANFISNLKINYIVTRLLLKYWMCLLIIAYLIK